MTIKAITIAVLLLSFIGCSSPKSGKGFTLPEGDLARGQVVYERMQCNACHQIDGVDQLTVAGEKSSKPIVLGGEVHRIRTYGQMVTSIINPSHKLARGYDTEEVSVDGESKMKNYNDVMTVAELCDVVTFVQSKFELKPYEPTPYPLYGPY